jgi:hypothetical protein
MVLVRTLEHLVLQKDTSHTEVDCTYSTINHDHGHLSLQVDPEYTQLRI